jgi:hypothetical protein
MISTALRESAPEERSVTIIGLDDPPSISSPDPSHCLARRNDASTTTPTEEIMMESQALLLLSSSLFKWTISAPLLQMSLAEALLRAKTTIVCCPLPHTSSIEAAQEILDRISNLMRLESIECEFDKETGRIDGRWECCLRFSIHLWSLSDNNRNDDQSSSQSTSSVVVECQRRQGCGIGMQYIRRGLFAAIKKNQHHPLPVLTRNSHVIPQRICTSFMRARSKQVAPTIGREQEEELDRETLLICHELLDSTQHCRNRLGLEQLLLLSKPVENGNKTVARALILNDGEDAAFMRKKVCKYLSEARDRPTHFRRRDHHTEMGQIALRILANSLTQIYATDGLRRLFNQDFIDPFWRAVQSHLRYNLRNAIHCPDDAALSAKCIRIVNEMCSNNDKMIVDDRFLSDLRLAHLYGSVHHLNLARESMQLIEYYRA